VDLWHFIKPGRGRGGARFCRNCLDILVSLLVPLLGGAASHAGTRREIPRYANAKGGFRRPSFDGWLWPLAGRPFGHFAGLGAGRLTAGMA
jgi:hypothetical protein